MEDRSVSSPIAPIIVLSLPLEIWTARPAPVLFGQPDGYADVFGHVVAGHRPYDDAFLQEGVINRLAVADLHEEEVGLGIHALEAELLKLRHQVLKALRVVLPRPLKGAVVSEGRYGPYLAGVFYVERLPNAVYLIHELGGRDAITDAPASKAVDLGGGAEHDDCP